ncbi:tRNA uridine-5-carboxymethylaminomethyl(34) synthesis GTPase MnmE [Ferruginibacter sp. HRS2-29]|uniref:tRNA uridine-5-carboxymethylaminomethyl(34) synthesis GTPase MnmE n=1 Tax=Ferruginibacter sp. HRS2-29 TaxID=2487334 RepID=UPI0020CCE901|nr:tRNA uridine-5-carboxymethylaminomethyl(34) synthesis GTPase MnmE [Ferruginibacter sp. HRS2-29]MCP9750270.1 tRNA uridine-5-carboxymethylaminomethyl(34) synthesis GTPase MnmE [Ferruginibacter sp. HRS2-29]
MINKLSGWGDTIAAIATAPGIGAIATIRLSGVDSFSIIDRLFPSKKISGQKTHTLHVGILSLKGKAIDEVVVAVFKGPKSYTGEDIIEISCHGSIFIQQQILSACIEEGARLARPGEFTQRSFLNGRMDLTQAEAVADLIASNTKASQKNALNNIRGGFSGQLKEMRDQLIQFAALIELELDFATEDVEFADRTKFYELIRHIDTTTTRLIDSFQLGNVIKNGISVAIIGKPNAGKSTLLNTLLNDNRAIVSEIAGTTRDTIEEVLNIRGILFRLIDTAGIRSHSNDVIENIGIEKSLEKMKSADVVLYIFDVNEETSEMIQQQVNAFKEAGINYLLVANKSDLDIISPLTLSGETIYHISAKNKINIDQLTNALYDTTVQGTLEEDSSMVTNIRHYEALQKVKITLTDIINGLDQQLSGDLLALEIRSCLYYLGEITGEITNEDKLDFIFSKFCIGK